MAHRVIPIPGGGTSVSQGPSIQINGLADEPVTLIISYNARPVNEGSRSCGILTFTDVMQYRWVAFGFVSHLTNKEDLEFGLIEITDSGLIEGMRVARPVQQHELVGVKHYRLAWDDYGTLDILSQGVNVSEARQDCP